MQSREWRWQRGVLLALLSLALGGPVRGQESPQQAATCAALLERWKAIAVIPLAEWRVHGVEGVRGEASDLDDSGWPSVALRKAAGAGSVWFRRSVEIPSSRSGYDFRAASFQLRIRAENDYPVHLWVYLNGVLRAQGYEVEPIPLVGLAGSGDKVLVAVKAQVPAGKVTLNTAQLALLPARERPDPRVLLEECASAELLNSAGRSGQEERARHLASARNAIDWAALEHGDQNAFDASVRQAQEKLEPLRAWVRGFSIRAVGNSHIDMAWLWPWTETVEVVRNTFASALNLMQEYPDFTYTHSTAQAYAWMEDKYPSLFEQIRRRVREGRWELIGGMWVESDQNLPDGESLTRQLLLGTRYFKEKFGVAIRVGWTPDSFGYTWQLPQIYKKSGMDFFVTQKLGWNDTTKFPHKFFWWESPDGSRVLTYFPHNYVNPIDPVRMARDLAEYTPKTGTPDLMHLYGVGDHGGGPTREMLENARRWQAPAVVYPQLSFSTVQSFFDELSKKLERLQVPVWKNELYLEYHRGIFTTQGETKKNNRRNEELLLNAEKISSLALLYGRSYPQEALNSAWKKVLFNQFHDILPGSGIAAVYRDAARDSAEVQRQGKEALSGAIKELLAHVRTEGPGVPVVVWNPLAWGRTDVVEAEVQLAQPAQGIELLDPAGQPALVDVLARDAATHRWKLRFLAEGVPGLGYKVFHARAVRSAPRPASLLVARPELLENEFLRVRVDPQTGCITSLFDKRANREALAPSACGNLLQTFVDKPRDWDAWNIDADFEKQRWDLTRAESVELVERGPVRAVIRVVKKFQNSTFAQDITMYPKIPRVDVAMTADWHEKHILLKVAFPVAVSSEFATFEIPYGTIPRPTTRRTPEGQAKFEVPALRWADLSDSSFGLSLLNDSKYGYDAKDNILRLSLLRSPEWPDPHADEGSHQFVYSFYPHAGTWKEAGTVRRGYELNYGLMAFTSAAHAGSLPPVHSFAGLEPENVLLTALKKAEDDNNLLLRFYEFAGRETQVRLRVPPGATAAVETNLMEQEERPLAIKGGEVIVPTHPYEIKTVKVRYPQVPPGSSR